MAPSADVAAPAPTPPLAPLIAAQLKFLLTNSSLPIKVVQIWSGCSSGRYADRFTLGIPFCLDYVYWDFLYNAMHPKVAPDVIFGQGDEGFQPLVDYDESGNGGKSCLAHWDYRDPRGLLCLVEELRLLYIEYQKKLVEKVDDARLKFEISTVLAKEGIEVSVVSSTGRSDEVKFAVPLLDLDLKMMVPGCPWKLPQKIHLQAIFPVSSSYLSVPSAPGLKLTSTPDLKSFFSVDGVKLPAWVDGMCMAEYIPTLEEDLKLQVVDASASIGCRRRFIEALAPAFGRPLEADPIFCRKATVLSISGIFTFLVHFVIPLQFPKQQPILTLQSCQHCNSQGIPITSSPKNSYPWSPRWEVTEMAERIYDYLADECQNFKKLCSDGFPQAK
ncbi:BRISC and BRCA1-A complex member 2 [Triticum aestivum]|uniref:BRISC and BRCA1-A complex member 2 n=1 Tax=Triticum aestivum TaxID=4565 RepID=UPI001D016C65|nr:BRISC and BRCA1-A complex member 2-like [Triticum aestivum]